MIDDDLELGQALRDLEHGFELLGIDGDGVEGEPRRGQKLERFDDAVLQQPARIGLVADEVAHADEFAAAAQPVERARSGVGIGQRQPADDAAHEIDLAAEIEAFLGLAADLVQDLHQHRALDAGALELRAQVVGGEIAREAVADESGPAIGVPAGPPEMMMRVDHGSIGCPSGWRSSDAAARTSA